MIKILIVMPKDREIDICIVRNLEKAGFQVELFFNKNFQVLSRSKTFRFINFLSKLFLRISIKKTLQKKQDRAFFKKRIKELDFYDLVLCIRPDILSLDEIKVLKNKSKRICAYQWDGLSRFRSVYSTISSFDSFFVFDKNDLNFSSKLRHTTNFCLAPFVEPCAEPFGDAFFIGDVDLFRYQMLCKIGTELINLGLRLNFNITRVPSFGTAPLSGLIEIKGVSYNQNLLMQSPARVIIDIAHRDTHSGLSFRFFEALISKKKVITTNTSVLEYDFYHPNNIYIYGYSEISVADFMSLPYFNIDPEIGDKYKIKNWINQFLD